MRFGEENDPKTEENVDGVAHNSTDLDELRHKEMSRIMIRILVLMRL